MRLSDALDRSLKVLKPKGGCPTCPRAKKNFVPATLTDSDLIVVGEAPDATEVEEGKGYTGKGGRFLRNTLEKHNITAYSLTHTIHCHPPDNRNPHKKEISCCLNQFVINEVRGHQTVLLTGKVPADTFFPNSTYKNLRGQVAWHPDFPGQRFYTIYHPGYISRHPDKGPEFEAQIARLSRILKEDPATPAWEIIRGDSPSAVEALRNVLANETYSFDVETPGLESWHPNQDIQSFAVCSKEDRAVFFHKSDPYWEEALNLLGESVQKTGTFIIAHNAGFDLQWLEEQLDVTAQCQIGDTQFLYYLLYMREDYHKARMPSLKFLTAEELDGYRYLVPAPHLCNDPDLLAKYNTEDVVRTLQLFRKGFPQLNDKQRDLFLRVGSPSSLALRRLTATGIGVDLDYCEELAQDLENKRENEINAWQKNDPEFDSDEHLSGDGFLRYVYQIRGFPVIKRTEKDKKPASDKNTIKELIRDHDADILKHRLKIQEIEKKLSTFVEPYRSGEHIDPHTGRVHPDYLNCFTRTGRASSRNPNGQNISRDSGIRRIFTAPGGKLFLQSDYSQIELRIAMVLSGDPTGLEAYRNDGDLHAKTAQKLAVRAGRDQWTKEDRTNAKIMNFSLIFGGSAGTVKRYAYSTFGINYSWDEAEKFHKTFFETYDRLQLWHQREIDRLRSNRGYIETVMGHPRYLDGWDSPDQGRREHFERVAINTMCQSPAGYLTLYTLYLVQQEIRRRDLHKKGVAVTGSVHDSILYESPPEYISTLINIVDECVAQVERWISDWFTVPLVMDYEVGPEIETSSWGTLEEITCIDIEDYQNNRYGCPKCPKCESYNRRPEGEDTHVPMVECKDCGYRQPGYLAA